jgi:ankyrin repeat protein
MAGFFEAATHFDETPQPLLELIASNADLGRSDRLGLTLLHYACREGHLQAVVSLVEAGVALEAQDRDARTPLHLACQMAGKLEHTRGRDHVAISNYLQECGAVTSTQDKYGHTPLSYLPLRAKRVGLMTPSVSGHSGIWAVEQVVKGSSVLNGSVAQSIDVRVLRP